MRVDKAGSIQWFETRIFISTALAHEDIGLTYEVSVEQWHVVFGPLSIGWLRETPSPLFVPSKGRMVDIVEREIGEREVAERKVSAMSSD